MILSSVRTALALAIQTNVTSTPPLRAMGYTPDSVDPPLAFVLPETIAFDQDFGRGCDRLDLTVRLIVSRADDLAGQALLDPYLNGSGAASVKRAVELDETLGGLVDTLQVVEARNYGGFEIAGVAFYGVDFAVSIWARG